MFCAMSSQGIVGPFFFDNTVNGERYKNMLETEFIPIAQGMDAVEGFWYMQDGAMPHRTQAVFDVLDEHFHGQVLALGYESRFGCGLNWPPYSPDLNPCDYFLWGYLKDQVYRTAPTTLEEPKDRIVAQVGAITTTQLESVIENFKKRLEKVQEQDGQHIEQFLH